MSILCLPSLECAHGLGIDFSLQSLRIDKCVISNLLLKKKGTTVEMGFKVAVLLTELVALNVAIPFITREGAIGT